MYSSINISFFKFWGKFILNSMSYLKPRLETGKSFLFIFISNFFFDFHYRKKFSYFSKFAPNLKGGGRFTPSIEVLLETYLGYSTIEINKKKWPHSGGGWTFFWPCGNFFFMLPLKPLILGPPYEFSKINVFYKNQQPKLFYFGLRKIFELFYVIFG